jgi:RNA polymerase sigma-70 factor (ECF subfamily)
MSAVLDPESSFDLLQRVKSGDAEALDRLLRRHLPALRRWATGRLPRWARDLSDTHDLVQDTVVQSLKHLQNFQPRREGALQAYLRTAIMNRIRDELRREHRRPAAAEITESMPTNTASPLAAAIGEEMLARYENALSQLAEEDREAIIARVELGHSYEQVAIALGKPSQDAARMTVQRALVKLAAKMHLQQ